MTLSSLCDVAYVVWLEQESDRDALESWLASDLVLTPVDWEKRELMDALRMSA